MAKLTKTTTKYVDGFVLIVPNMQQKIIPHVWFNTEAKEAAEFYTGLFASGGEQAESKITNSTTLHNTPSGDSDIVSFTL